MSERVSSRDRMRTEALFWAALVMPVLLIAIVHLGIGDGFAARRSAESVPLVGVALKAVTGLVLTVYFPPFLVSGSVDPVFAFVGLYALLALVFFLYRRWGHGLVLLILPAVTTWLFSGMLLAGD
ncbi:MAG: hypothetical protein M1389_08345 [Chloroflexi bacterium]|nr:hypothetical protein [Chloroflexota bacterium]